MKRLSVAKEEIASFEKLLLQEGVIQESRGIQTRPGAETFISSLGPFFDLDRLWYSNTAQTALRDIVVPIAKQLVQKTKVDLIICVIGSVGSLGPIALASSLALQFRLNLVIMGEGQFGSLALYPLTLPVTALFSEKRVLVLKDVITFASSVQRAVQVVSQNGGFPAAFMTLVDKRPSGRNYDFGEWPEDAWYAALLEDGSHDE